MRILVYLFALALLAQEAAYQSFHLGSKEAMAGHPTAGYLLAGGGNTTDEAYRWFAKKAGGGDAVTLRASGADAMNKVLLEGGGLNAAVTFLFKNRAASSDPAVVESIRKASVIWIAGGDQWNYIRMWKGTPVGDAINQRVYDGVPVGGSSAGLAVLGEFSFSAEHDCVTSKQALANPFDPAVALATDFIHIPLLKGIITDTHWVKRDRLGRTLVFLARLVADGKVRPASSIAVDEGNAVTLEPDGSARVSGPGAAYFLRTTALPAVCEPGKPLTLAGIQVYRITSSGRFDVKNWRGEGGLAYRLDVDAGVVRSSQTGGSLY
jgi:cyanophycinase